MRIFISWSGVRSQRVAEALRDWLPNVIQALQPWMSASDIDKGVKWRTEIAAVLEQTSIGIICLTPENLNAPWILFEAGALSKLQQNAYICTFLYGLEPADLTDPLAQFQTTKAQKEDARKLIHTINQALVENALSENKVNDAFDIWWPKLEEHLRVITSDEDISRPKRRDREVLEEILERVRTLTRSLNSGGFWGQLQDFKVGQKVIYPNHGIGTIEQIEQKQIGDAKVAFYTIKLAATNTVVLVPVTNATEVGLRAPIALAEAETLIMTLPDTVEPLTYSKSTFKEFSDKMRTGNIFEVADVLKKLTYVAQSNPLSFREQRMLERARFLVISELAGVMQDSDVNIEKYVDEALERFAQNMK